MAARPILAMMTEAEDKVTNYREAYEAWQRHLGALHEFFLEKKRIAPPQLKGILNREARAKHRYDEARRRLLGIEDDASLFDDETADEDV